MSEINIDESMIQNDVSLNHKEEKLVEMSNGCICCTLREDLLVEVNKLAKEGKFDYLLIESTESQSHYQWPKHSLLKMRVEFPSQMWPS